MRNSVTKSNGLGSSKPECRAFNNTACSFHCLRSIYYSNSDQTIQLGRCNIYNNSYVLLNTDSNKLVDYYGAQNLLAYKAYYRPFRMKIFRGILHYHHNLQLISRNSALDIGCGFGWLLELLREEGYQDLMGIEDSRAGEEARAKGFEVLTEHFTTTLILNKYFDLIVLSNVLEHLEKPLDCLIWIREHLRPGGNVLLTVPISNGLIMRFVHVLFAYFPNKLEWLVKAIYQTDTSRPHLVLYSLDGLIKICRQAGFNVADIKFSPIVDPDNVKGRMKINQSYLSPAKFLCAGGLRVLLKMATFLNMNSEVTLILTPGDESY